MPNIVSFQRNDKLRSRALTPAHCEYTTLDHIMDRRLLLVAKIKGGGRSVLEINQESAAELMHIIREAFPDIDEVSRLDPRAN